MKIDRFLEGFTALHEEPGDIYTPILLPGDFDPFERHKRFTLHIDAELRMTGLGSAGGGSSISARDVDEDDEDEGDGWEVIYSIIDADVTDLDAGRALIRLHLAELGCPPGTLVQFGEHEDRWDGECWHLAEDRSINEDDLDCRK
ncbi:hypothetical protein OF829_05605 [Sphingomonas sp. LB-2]|uniref:hypothetical protein n=1 Tax=Sphingomonas caeni TaxID=2984949 RepID=UPI0022312FF5|nr:hypothetical protein [Sphingomonas caeni]MCW3846706.1 hypothetical protein [Sphingomonas caeni]